LEGIFDSLPSLAKELGKLPPIINIQDNGYVIHTQVSSTIKNVFMHLLRNSMDHGLESPEERLEQKKPAAGTIQLQMDVSDGMLQLKLSDDGRGLAMGRIRKIAMEKEWISPDEKPSDEETANLILRPGFTTAKSVTEVSGRGVGMDAVINFVKGENGTVKIRFKDDQSGADFRQFETIVYLPEVLSESVEGLDLHSEDEADETLVDLSFAEKSATKALPSMQA
jgi:hypothetical protein